MKVITCGLFGVLLCLSCSDMEVQWVQAIEPAGTGTYVCNDLVSLRNKIVVTGSFCAPDEVPGCYTAVYNEKGDVVWHDMYNGEDQEITFGLALAVLQGQTLDTTSEVYVLCQARRVDEAGRLVLLKYTDEGTRLWARTVKTGIRNMYGDLRIDMHGRVQVFAWLSILGEPDNIFLARFNPEGELMWSTAYAHPAFSFRDVHFDMRGGEQLVVAGIADLSRDFFYLRYGERGDLQALNIIDLEGIDQTCAAVRLGAHGSVYLTGACVRDTTHDDWVTVALDHMDNRLWVQYYDDAGYDDVPTDLTIDEAGNVYVTGTSADDEGSARIVTVCYDTLGDQRWVSTYRGSSGENAEPFALEPSFLDRTLRRDMGYFYLIGRAGNDALILKHTTGGLYTWAHREKGAPGSTYAPVAVAHNCLAIAETSEEGPRVLVLKYGKAEQWGCARWD